MIKCVIIDDEPLAVKVLEKYLPKATDLNLVGSFTDAEKALQFLHSQQVDLLFLDINMPKINGLSLIHLLEPIPLIVFTTAYPEYAVQSYEFDAVDYLLKPFGPDRFQKAVDKVRDRLQIKPVEEEAEGAFLVVKADRKTYRLAYQDIDYFQAYGDYVKIRTSNGWIVPKTTLAKLEQELQGETFLRTHRTFIVNAIKVQYLEGNQLSIKEDKIPISKAYKEKVLQKLGM